MEMNCSGLCRNIRGVPVCSMHNEAAVSGFLSTHFSIDVVGVGYLSVLFVTPASPNSTCSRRACVTRGSTGQQQLTLPLYLPTRTRFQPPNPTRIDTTIATCLNKTKRQNNPLLSARRGDQDLEETLEISTHVPHDRYFAVSGLVAQSAYATRLALQNTSPTFHSINRSPLYSRPSTHIGWDIRISVEHSQLSCLGKPKGPC
ncbi:hypothetical protein B0T21DRAFT_169778 [Apiosordaria backusii]|uniref:Uncharacterized protein n=1 Tax=Apiosordaria backusii TaxID=314023 RepID=A0AA40EGK2_9PEZI|nr:hypothetical protein B0T21DRAFT_169778 [Apiosordaria backusii]